MIALMLSMAGLLLFCSCGKPEKEQLASSDTVGSTSDVLQTAETENTTVPSVTTETPGFDISRSDKYSKIACVGDSITYGYGASDRNTKSYPALLQGMLGSRYTVRNFGWGGASYSGLTRIYTEGTEFRDSLEFLPDVVIIMLGTNDTNTWKDTGASMKEYAQDMVRAYKALKSHPAVFICTPIQRYIGETNNTIIGEEIVPIFRTLAEEEDCFFVNLYDETADWQDNLMDGLHPNDTGYAKLAEMIYSALENAS